MKIRSRIAAVAAVAGLSVACFGGGVVPSAVASNGVAHASCVGGSRVSPAHSLRPVPAPYCVPFVGTPVRRSGRPNWRGFAIRRAALPQIGGSWFNIGPASLTGNDSGRVTAIAYDTPLSEVFLGTANGGVWKSSSPFTSWTPITDSVPNLAIGAIAVDPTDGSGNTIYVGTGEPNGAGDNMYGAGVYKTTDGGATWTQEGATSFGYNTISRIVVDANTGDIYASVENGTGGVWMSTDHGVTWTNPSNLNADSVSDLQIDSAGDVYAAVGNNYNNQPGRTGIWECAAPCGATPTFVNINGAGFPGASAIHIKLALANPAAAAGSQTLFAIATGTAYNQLLGLYRGTGAGNTGAAPSWAQIESGSAFVSGATSESQGWYDLFIHAVDTNTVYVDGVSTYMVTNASGTPTLNDVACSYGDSGIGSGPYHCAGSSHPDQHAIAPGPGTTLFFGGDGGVIDTTDGSAPAMNTWNNLNGNLSTMQFYGGGVGSASGSGGCTSGAGVLCDGSIRIGGMQDNGTAQTSTTIGPQWSNNLIGGDGGYATVDPANNNNEWGESQYAFIQGTNDDWASSFSATPTVCGGGVNTATFMSPMLYDSATRTLLSAPTGHLCSGDTSTAGAITWTDISGATTPNSIVAIARSHAGGIDAIYMADSNGDLWYHTAAWHSMDAGSCPTISSGPNCAAVFNFGTMPGLQPNGGSGHGVDAMVADPTTPGVVYAVVSAFQGSTAGHIFRGNVDLVNNTFTWTDIGTSLPDEPFESVALDPSTPTTLYVGGSPGVYVSQNAQDASPTWSIMGAGLPNSPVFGLQVSPDSSDLVAFTHGRSVWNLPIGAPTPVTVTAGSPTTTYGQADVTVTYSKSSSTLCQSGAPNPYCKTRAVNPIVTCAYSGGVTPSIAATGLTPARSGAPAGPYSTSCWGAFDPSYTFTYVAGTLTINPAPITIHSGNETVAYGSVLPRLRWKAHFVNHDTAASLSKQPTCRVMKLRLNRQGLIVSPAGTYQIRCTGAKDPNYKIGYAAGTLRVRLARTKLSDIRSRWVTRLEGERTSATLMSVNGRVVRGRSVVFKLGSGNAHLRCSGVTNEQGVAACTMRHLPRAITGTQELSVIFRGDPTGPKHDYAKSKTTAIVTVTRSQLKLLRRLLQAPEQFLFHRAAGEHERPQAFRLLNCVDIDLRRRAPGSGPGLRGLRRHGTLIFTQCLFRSVRGRFPGRDSLGTLVAAVKLGSDPSDTCATVWSGWRGRLQTLTGAKLITALYSLRNRVKRWSE